MLVTILVVKKLIGNLMKDGLQTLVSWGAEFIGYIRLEVHVKQRGSGKKA